MAQDLNFNIYFYKDKIMNSEIRKLKSDRFAVWEQMKSLNDKSGRENRVLTSTEENTWNKMEADIKAFDSRIERAESLVSADERAMNADADELSGLTMGGEFASSDGFDYRSAKGGDSLRASFNRYLLDGDRALNQSEFRALQSDIDSSGGYLLAPIEMVREIVKARNATVFMRKISRIFPCAQSESLGIPTVETALSDPIWTAEIGTGDEDSSLDFGKRELTPHPLAKRIKVSRKLLNRSALNPEQIVCEQLNFKFSAVEENSYMNGDGSNEPLGIFTAADSGISTSRDISTGNTSTSIKSDGLIECYHNVREAYRKNASWVFSDSAIKQIRKLKDGEGQYLWSPGLTDGKPDCVLGRKYFISEYAPDTFTTGEYVAVFGDFSFYWIADALRMEIQRLVELYAENNQVGFIGRLESDGMPVLAEAFSRMKLA